MNTLVHPACGKVRSLLAKFKGRSSVVIDEHIKYSDLCYIVTFTHEGQNSQGRFLQSWFDDYFSDGEKEEEIKAELTQAIRKLK